MSKNPFFAVGLAVLLAACATPEASRSVARVNASTAASAESSYKTMMSQLSESKQRQLALAVLALNMVGVNSAYEMVNNPALQAPSVGRIKDRVAGMSADEIIALAAKTSTVRFEIPGR